MEVSNHATQCICGEFLTGRKKKWCSKRCKCRNNSSYPAQHSRGLARRSELITLLGGKCCVCGYSKYLGSLHFHHTDPQTKLFQLDMRSCSNRSPALLLAESRKCILLCANCHSEHHHLP
jgi:hypothetical protein